MQILVVDDQGSVRALVRSALRQIGQARVVEAEDGVDALQALARDRFALVVTDLIMPRLDGMGLLRAMRETPHTERTPVVLLTGHAANHTIVEAAKLGVVGVIAKPFSIADLAKRLAAILGKLPQAEAVPQSVGPAAA